MAVVHSGRATPAARRRPGGRSLGRSHGAECRRLLRGAQVGRMPLSIARPGLTILPLGRLDVDRRGPQAEVHQDLSTLYGREQGQRLAADRSNAAALTRAAVFRTDRWFMTPAPRRAGRKSRMAG